VAQLLGRPVVSHARPLAEILNERRTFVSDIGVLLRVQNTKPSASYSPSNLCSSRCRCSAAWARSVISSSRAACASAFSTRSTLRREPSETAPRHPPLLAVVPPHGGSLYQRSLRRRSRSLAGYVDVARSEKATSRVATSAIARRFAATSAPSEQLWWS